MTIKIETATISDILTIDAQIPEFDGRNTPDKVEARLHGKKALILAASEGGQLVGFKVGYELSKSIFYSWIGGVIPQMRKQSIADQLRIYQENWAYQQGYRFIQVKSMNRYPAMLQFLISRGYQVVGYENSDTLTEDKVVFQKALCETNHELNQN